MADDKKFQWLNLSEVVEMISKRQEHLAPGDAKAAVDITIDYMRDAFAQGQRIEIRRFGSFSLHKRKQNLTRNLKTSEMVLVPERFSPHFKPSAQLRERVNASAALPIHSNDEWQ